MMNTDGYKSQVARDAQAAGYGDERYWRSLDEHAAELSAKGVEDAYTRTLSEALIGNDGD